MKKLFALFLCLLLLRALFPASSLPAAAEKTGDYEYSVADEAAKTCEITKYTGSGGDIVIPSVLDGYKVTAINYHAFEGCASLASVKIPASVTKIGMGAFANCVSLTSVTIPDSVTQIGEYFWYDIGVFSGCTSLTDITIPDSVTWIGWGAFEGCTSLTGVTIPDSVTAIGDGAFGDCVSLASITIPDSVTYIGKAFFGCTSLTSVMIPDSVTCIGWGAFEGCTSLASVTIPDSVTAIYQCAFHKCTSLKITTISDNVTYIGRKAFCNTAYYNDPSNWTSEGVLYIDKWLIEAKDTFHGKYRIRPGTIGIANDAFLRCVYLKSVIIPNTVIYINDFAFHECASLTNLTIPDSVTEISWDAFASCTSLTSVTIGDSVTEIGDLAFCGCTSLTSVTIPDSVMRIGMGAFSNCTSLTEINVSAANKKYVSQGGVLFTKSMITLHTYPAGKSNITYTVPYGVKWIGWHAFSGCTAITSVEIPDSVTRIDDEICMDFYTGSAFYGCTSLTSVTIPDSVTFIGEEAFEGCDKLTIYGFAGSYAAGYAAENSIPFQAVEKKSLAYGAVSVTDSTPLAIPEDAVLRVVKPEEAAARTTYDISLKKGGAKVQPRGSVSVKVPVPEVLDGNICKVYRVEADGSYTDMCAAYDGAGFMTFSTNSFGKYLVTDKALGDANGDGEVDNLDAALVLRYDAGIVGRADIVNFDFADVTGDCDLDNLDAAKILQYDAGIIDGF